ncbi:MAG: hypothetical protein BWK76_07890 [Desulfobulbaceae bacterium A2]|nr:MAG: hypothetical protein BWK76_07890 [Desulfobulbaceae bacterium A2]
MEKTLQKTQVSTGEITLEAAGSGAAQAGIGIITIMSALVGLWGLACLVGGLMAAGGPLELVRAWLGAVTGM